MSTKNPISERQARVLEQVVRRHLETGQPVGSVAIARSGEIGLGAASVRRIMSELEDLGLLTHPHTSAGRVPTDLGYRVYVDALAAEPHAVPPDRAVQIERTYFHTSEAKMFKDAFKDYEDSDVIVRASVES